MKLALLKGNRFNPWHLQAYTELPNIEVTAFRAESEIQSRFEACDDGSAALRTETIYFDTQGGGVLARAAHILRERYGQREPRILPFADRLQGYDAILTWELFTDWSREAIEARKRFGVPIAVMVWDNILFNQELPSYKRAIKKDVIEHADCFVVHTERSRRVLLLEGVNDDKIVLFPPGVDSRLFSPGEVDRRSFGLSDSDFVISFVGWLLPRKGIDFLLAAVRELVNEGLPADRPLKLLIVGSGPGKKRVETLIERLGLQEVCRFFDALPYNRMPEIYRASDVYAQPSIATPTWQEQFGMALIEAMATALPVVTTYSGAIPEIAGASAMLCQPDDFVSLHDALAELIGNPARRRELGDAARRRVEQQFTRETFSHNLAALFTSLAQRRG